MKKILFSLMALVCSMSMNAQVVKLMKGNTVVATYKASQVDNIVFEEEEHITGTAKRTGNIDVNWVRLWKNGPKFAEYNVGAANNNAEDYGGYYCWGSSIDKDQKGVYKGGSGVLTGTDDTATNLWGSAWRMPTQAELQALHDNCDIDLIAINGVNGCKFTGRGDYSSNSVFLPAAGYFDYKELINQGDEGNYWSSTPDDSTRSYFLYFESESEIIEVVVGNSRDYGYPVRAVLKE